MRTLLKCQFNRTVSILTHQGATKYDNASGQFQKLRLNVTRQSDVSEWAQAQYNYLTCTEKQSRPVRQTAIQKARINGVIVNLIDK